MIASFTMLHCVAPFLLIFWIHHIVTVMGSWTRIYYIAAVEKEWDYAPGGVNRIQGTSLVDDSQAAIFTQRGVNRIGTQYKKVLYREFTDGNFTQEKPHPQHLGLLGPMLKAEAGDTIKVHFKNMAGGRPFSVHAHGVFYDKSSEGAVYSKKEPMKGDQVEPGNSYEYIWRVNEDHAPTEADGDCVTRMYHSHVVSIKDTNTGLIGPLLICKPGVLVENTDKRRNVDREYPLLFTLMDENESWLLKDNIEHSTNPEATRNLIADGSFINSNRMASINGFMYGNVPGLHICKGDLVSWHLIGLGTWADIHNPSFYGHTVKIGSHRTDTTTLLPATFKTAYMKAINPGTWLLNCMNDRFFEEGMSARFNVSYCGNGVSSRMPNTTGGKTRTYYMAAEEVMWDYGPSGVNEMDGKPLTSPGSEASIYFIRSDVRLGGRYKKVLFVEYLDQNFTVKKTRSSDEVHLGFLGPVIRAEVGDEIVVVFRNKASRNYSIHPRGVLYDKANEGATYEDGTSGNDTADNSVMPNETFVYTWSVPEEVGPAESDPQCLTWLYQSSVDPVKDKHSGLVGPLLICKRGTLDEQGQQKNINGEFILRFAETLEAKSWYFDENKELLSDPSKIDENDPGFQTSNNMRSINGYMFGNLPGLRMCKGDRVSWHLIGGIGTHSAYFYGNNANQYGNNRDTLGMMPGTLATLYMTPDNPGYWKIICRVNANLNGGMSAKYIVRNDCGEAGTEQRSTGKKRWYYIAAVEETWDYAPSGMDMIGGVPLEENEEIAPFTVPGPNHIGRRNKKVLYREFTDATFAKQKQRGEKDRHLGIMGPMIKAEVGDTIEILFKNLATRHFSMHSHGILYSKKDEGSSYQDNTTGSDTVDNAIAPGKVYNYVWEVPERSGPGPNETGCVAWGYYSDVDPVKDTNSGLVGPLVICKKGTLNDRNKRNDVDREFAVLFDVFNENDNWFLDENIRTYLTEVPGSLDELKSSFDFWVSNLKGTINGLVSGNVEGLRMYKNEKVVWYLLHIGGNTEMHTVHFHGQSMLYKSSKYHRGDVYDLLPESFAAVEMIPDAIGTWLLHCHVNIHISTGMRALFTVMAPTDEPGSKHPPPHGGCAKSHNCVGLIVLGLLLFLSHLM